MTFKTWTLVFVALSVATAICFTLLLTDAATPHPALLGLVLLNSATFGGMVLTYRDSDITLPLRVTTFAGILCFTALANALDVYGWIALLAALFPFIVAVALRYFVLRA